MESWIILLLFLFLLFIYFYRISGLSWSWKYTSRTHLIHTDVQTNTLDATIEYSMRQTQLLSLGEVLSLPEALWVPATSQQWPRFSHRTPQGEISSFPWMLIYGDCPCSYPFKWWMSSKESSMYHQKKKSLVWLSWGLNCSNSHTQSGLSNTTVWLAQTSLSRTMVVSL